MMTETARILLERHLWAMGIPVTAELLTVIDTVVAAEREACAKIADEVQTPRWQAASRMAAAIRIAAAIRARGANEGSS
jgi:hypothetical protein